MYTVDPLEAEVKSITTNSVQHLYLSRKDVDLLKGKKVGIIDDVVSTGGSLKGLEEIVKLAGGEIVAKAFVLAEGDAKDRDDIIYLAYIPVFVD